MEMKDSSKLSFRCRSIFFTTFLGKEKCHQNFNVIEYPPHASSELSPTIDAVGDLGMRWAIGVSNLMPKSGFSASAKKFNSFGIVLFTRYVLLLLFTIFTAFFMAKLICCWWSEILPEKVFVEICFTKSLKPLELLSNNSVLLLRANVSEA